MITPSKEFWKIFKETNGALSCAEALAIMNITAEAAAGNHIELGTYKGKSALAARYGLRYGIFYLVDPIFEDKDLCTTVVTKLTLFTKFGGQCEIKTSDKYSTEGIIEKYAPYSYVFVDSGSHQDGLPMQEVKLLEDRVISGGIIAFHDWNSQFSEVKEAADYLVSTGKYDYISINWDEINTYVNENNLNEGNQSWHHTELENPNFIGALRRK